MQTPKNFLPTFALALLLTGFASALPAQERTRMSATGSDAAILDRVADALLGYAYYQTFDWVEGSVQNGVVTLRGWVVQPGRQDLIVDKIARIPGVQGIDEQIQVLPVSTQDNRLRVAAARALFLNSSFREYAAQGNPPIHIVVNRGTVALYGSVDDAQERRLAEALVRSRTPAVKVVNYLDADG